MNKTFTTEMSPVLAVSSWRHRTPEALGWMWLVLFVITLMFAVVSGSGPAEFAFMQCVLSSLAAVCVTHAGLRDAHTWARRVLPVRRLDQRLQDMVQGWCMTGALLGLSTVVASGVLTEHVSVSHMSELGAALSLALVWHTVWVCAVYAWWGVLPSVYLAAPMLVGLITVWEPGRVLGAWQPMPFGLWLLAAACGLGVSVWMFRMLSIHIRSGATWRRGPGGRLDAWLSQLLAHEGFIVQGRMAGRSWGAIFGSGLIVAMIPVHQMGSYHLLEPWGSELTFYEPWRIGFLCMLLLPWLRSSQWHWRYLLSPGGQARQHFGLNVIKSTLRFVALWFWPAWALAYVTLQLCFTDQGTWQILAHLGLFAPFVLVDFWVAIALLTCLYGALRAWSLLFIGVLMVSPVIWMLVTQMDSRLEGWMHLGHRQGAWLVVMTMIALALTLAAQRIWRKADLGKVWREYETKTQEFQN
jgi:hypothetical protein